MLKEPGNFIQVRGKGIPSDLIGALMEGSSNALKNIGKLNELVNQVDIKRWHSPTRQNALIVSFTVRVLIEPFESIPKSLWDLEIKVDYPDDRDQAANKTERELSILIPRNFRARIIALIGQGKMLSELYLTEE